jgi:gamma-glutamyltranspeptidase/glutathione hydrolase
MLELPFPLGTANLRWLIAVCIRVALPIVVAMLFLFASTGFSLAAEAQHAMIAAEGDQAAQAGLDVLKHGGNAVDAAVATSLALGVTNSGSCGIGGGGFMLIYWARDHKFYALDYREVAPYAASSSMYLHDGKPDEELARSGPLAVAVPGEIAGLDAALRRFGTMKFSALAAPAIRLAENGFPLSPHMARDVAYAAAQIKRDPGFAATFFKPDGSPLKSGDIVHAKLLADLLRSLADNPAQEFYRGKVAKQIIAYMQAKDGLVTEEDLADYHPIWRDPLHFSYRGYDLYTMPPPSSGGVVLEMLGMLAPGHVEGLGFNSPAYLAQLIQIMRMGFVDRDSYADPAFVKVPTGELLSPAHLAQARKLALHGSAPLPPAAHDHGTSNFCVVDKAGNIVDVTTTINTIFGAKIMIPDLGLILNDEMDDFAIAPGVPNAFKLVQAAANKIEPGKRPLSSMSPLIAMHHGAPALVLGGSGGPTIITGVEQVVLDLLDFRMEAQHAVQAPRIHHQAEPVTVFAEKDLDPKTIAALSQMGFQIKVVPELGAITAIKISPGDLDGGFDPRKGGAAIGY